MNFGCCGGPLCIVAAAVVGLIVHCAAVCLLPLLQGMASGSSTVEETLRQELNSQRDVATRLRQELTAARQQVRFVVHM